MRRIEALTGDGALQYEQKRDGEWRELVGLLKTSPQEVLEKTKKLLKTLKETERALEQAKQKALDEQGAGQEATIREVKGVPVLVQRIDGLNMQELRTFSDKLRNKVATGLLVLGSVLDDKVALLVIVGKDQSQAITCRQSGATYRAICGWVWRWAAGYGSSRRQSARAFGYGTWNKSMSMSATQLG